jgi:hypothetical protein
MISKQMYPPMEMPARAKRGGAVARTAAAISGTVLQSSVDAMVTGPKGHNAAT